VYLTSADGRWIETTWACRTGEGRAPAPLAPTTAAAMADAASATQVRRMLTTG
jgi:hypothetical protein